MVTLAMIHVSLRVAGRTRRLLDSRRRWLSPFYYTEASWPCRNIQNTASDSVLNFLCSQQCQDGMWNEFCEICAVFLQSAGRGKF